MWLFRRKTRILCLQPLSINHARNRSTVFTAPPMEENSGRMFTRAVIKPASLYHRSNKFVLTAIRLLLLFKYDGHRMIRKKFLQRQKAVWQSAQIAVRHGMKLISRKLQ